MKEAFEKIIEMFKKRSNDAEGECYRLVEDAYLLPCEFNKIDIKDCEACCFSEAVEIVNQVAEECNDGWIPYNEKTPEFELYTLTPVWVTIRKKDGTFCWVTLLRWNGYDGRLEWNNGKSISDTYEVLAWKKVNYPAPYKPKGEQ